jgi:hypothetical protein
MGDISKKAANTLKPANLISFIYDEIQVSKKSEVVEKIKNLSEERSYVSYVVENFVCYFCKQTLPGLVGSLRKSNCSWPLNQKTRRMRTIQRRIQRTRPRGKLLE